MKILVGLGKSKEEIVKVKERECPIDGSLRLLDIAMKPRANKEDEAFSLDP